MKIQFITNYSKLYGANKILLDLLKYLKSEGYDISILVPSNGDLVHELEKEGIKYEVIFYYSSFLYFKKTIKFIAYPLLLLINIVNFPRIYYHIKKQDPDLIYSNTSAENIGILVAKLLGKKHITHVHEFMSLDHGALFIGGHKLKKNFLDKSDGLIFVTKAVASHILGEGYLQGKHRIIYNGLSMPKVQYDNIPKFNAPPVNYGIVGIFSRGKRQDIAIKYFKKIKEIYPQSKLHLYGDKEGAYKTHLINLVKELGLDSDIIFHGFEKDIEKIYRDIDILLMFSKSEGFGLVTLEAMLRKIPVIGYDSAGTLELIGNENSGYLFKDIDSFIDAVKQLQSPVKYNNIRENAFERAQLLFSDKNFCINIENFINQIANNE
jgi:glycosyltransferase involved in cell wall biosynthesis